MKHIYLDSYWNGCSEFESLVEFRYMGLGLNFWIDFLFWLKILFLSFGIVSYDFY